ncbi:MAG: hypothetical protein M1833_007162 [Piccolia ochrophora]|nr:MAG: hypothetical protein M1833_007162 [Piccolia ochrophora]
MAYPYYGDGPPPRQRYYYHPGNPVVVPASRPRYGRRLHTDDEYAGAGYYGGDALLVPELGGGLHRSRSTGYRRPHTPGTPVVINNHIAGEELPIRGRQRLSVDERDSPPPSPYREHARRARAATSRSPSPYLMWQQDMENQKMKQEIEDLRRKKEEEAQAERLKRDFLLNQAKEDVKKRQEEERRKEEKKRAVEEWKKEEEERKRKEKEAQERAVEAWKRKEEERKQKEKAEAEKREEEYKERLKRDLGLTENQVMQIVKKDKDKDKTGLQTADNRPTTYTKISRKHISIETLRAFALPFKLDDRDPDGYVLIKRWVPEYEQDSLWEHTRRLREDRDADRRHMEMKILFAESQAKKKAKKRASISRSKSPGIFDFLGGK